MKTPGFQAEVDPPASRALARELGPFFQGQAVQALLSLDPVVGLDLKGPERDLPWLVRVIRMHAAGLPRMALSQLLSRARGVFAQPAFARVRGTTGAFLLDPVPVLTSVRSAMLEACRRVMAAHPEEADASTGVIQSSFHVRLRLAGVQCRRRAHPDWPGPAGLHLVLMLVDPLGRVARRTVDHRGNLGAGETWTPEQVLQELRVDADSRAAEDCFTAVLFVGDVELSTFANVLEEVFENLRCEVSALVAEIAGLHLPGWTVNAAVAEILSELVGWLTPVTCEPLLETHAAGVRFVGRTRGPWKAGAFRTELVSGSGGGGEYAIWLDWEAEG